MNVPCLFCKDLIDSILQKRNTLAHTQNYYLPKKYFSMSHEMFHNMGAFHNRANSGTQHAYAHGVQVEGKLRTIMSYNCKSNCPRIPYLSADGYKYGDTLIGDSSNNNARMIAESIATIASWKARSPVSPPVPAPVSPTIPAPVAPPVPAVVPPPMAAPVTPPIRKPSNARCFSDHMVVMVQGKKGATRMDELQIGDAILTSKGYSKVYSFGHYEPSRWTEFLQIYTTNSQQAPLEITADHLLYYHNNSTCNIELAPAGQVKVGDFLVTSNDRLSQVEMIQKIHRQGIYAPFTESGDIVVNGIAASVYIALPPAFQSHLSFEQQHWLQQKYYSPFRLFCHVVGCKADETGDTGFPIGVSMWLPLLHWLECQNGIALRSFLYLVAIPLALGLQLLEYMFFNVWRVIAAILGFSYLMKRLRKSAFKLHKI